MATKSPRNVRFRCAVRFRSSEKELLYEGCTADVHTTLAVTWLGGLPDAGRVSGIGRCSAMVLSYGFFFFNSGGGRTTHCTVRSVPFLVFLAPASPGLTRVPAWPPATCSTLPCFIKSRQSLTPDPPTCQLRQYHCPPLHTYTAVRWTPPPTLNSSDVCYHHHHHQHPPVPMQRRQHVESHVQTLPLLSDHPLGPLLSYNTPFVESLSWPPPPRPSTTCMTITPSPSPSPPCILQ